MGGIYNPNGSIRVTIVSPTDTPVGLYAPDGSFRVTDAETDNQFGVYSKNGAYRVNFTLTGRMYDPTGAYTYWGLSNGRTYE